MIKYHRHHLHVLKSRIAEKRRFIQVVLGPRQVGKTTLVNQLLTSFSGLSVFASADAVGHADTVWLDQQWEAARILLKKEPVQEVLLVIDEIQKISNWSEQVKQKWDEDSRLQLSIKVILLGSSRLLLQEGLTESLTGRFESIYLPHWSYSEMHAAFGWTHEQFVWFGGYPGAAELIADEQRWKNYVQHSLIETSISKDILMLTRVDKPALMKRLFELGCDYSGQVLSFNKMLGQFVDAGNTTTLAHYLDLLGTAGLLSGIEKFSGNKIRQRSSSPKFVVHNTSFLAARSELSFEQAMRQPALWGRIVETAIGAHLLNHSLAENFQLSYWRDGNNEVDYVIHRGEQVIAIEVKTGAQQVKRGSEAFKKKYPGTRFIAVDESGAFNWRKFLEMNAGSLF